jgi:multidrug transporter EmrE-like cation transporter
MINIGVLAFGLAMASLDGVILSLLKAISLGWLGSIRWMIIPTLVYAIQPWIFLQSLKLESLTVMNLLWDVLSDVIVTLIGLFYFGETLSWSKKLGVVLSLFSVYLLTHEDEAT